MYIHTKHMSCNHIEHQGFNVETKKGKTINIDPTLLHQICFKPSLIRSTNSLRVFVDTH